MPDQPPLSSSKLQIYLRGAFPVLPGALTHNQQVRALIKWFFDLLRNVMICGLLLFFAKKTGSSTIYIIAFVPIVLLGVYCISYLDTVHFSPFHFLKNRRLAWWLDLTANFLIILPFSFGIQLLLPYVVFEIANSYQQP